jgi:hypothetical protein
MTARRVNPIFIVFSQASGTPVGFLDKKFARIGRVYTAVSDTLKTTEPRFYISRDNHRVPRTPHMRELLKKYNRAVN